jgi:fatty-acyl-CoA synthase
MQDYPLLVHKTLITQLLIRRASEMVTRGVEVRFAAAPWRTSARERLRVAKALDQKQRCGPDWNHGMEFRNGNVEAWFGIAGNGAILPYLNPRLSSLPTDYTSITPKTRLAFVDTTFVPVPKPAGKPGTVRKFIAH